MFWAAANGGVTNGGLRGVWPPVLEIGRNRPFSPFFCLFRPFRRGRRAPGKSRKRRKKAFFLRYPGICLNPDLLNLYLRHSKCFCSSCAIRCSDPDSEICWGSTLISHSLASSRTRMEESIAPDKLWQVRQDVVDYWLGLKVVGTHSLFPRDQSK